MASNTQYFKDVFDFLCKFRWIFRSSNTRFLVDGVFNEIPPDWVPFLQSLDNQQFNQLPIGLQHLNMPSSLNEFLVQLNRLRPAHTIDITFPPVAKFNGISPKKLHEIYKFSIEIHNLITANELDAANVIIVDLGCGLGYLSQLLAQLYDYRVLGLEADSNRVFGARRRQTKLFGHTLQSVFYAEHFIDPTQSAEFIKAEITSKFNPSPLSTTRIVLVGLHACADLTITACRLFSVIDIARILSIMPCCYHKMNMHSTGFENIPLSQCMKKAIPPTQDSWYEIINRPFLRLACQQTAARWSGLSDKDHEIHGRNMYNRGLVELVLNEGEHVAKLNTTLSESSASYPCALNGYQLYSNNLPIPWKEEHFQRLEQQNHQNGIFMSEVLTGLQAAIQSICENLVLMDKVCFLQEMTHPDGTSNRFVGLKKIFEEALSPRCYTLIATK